MALIRKRGDFQWQARVIRLGAKPATKTFNTYDEARAWATRIEAEIDKGVFVHTGHLDRLTLCDLLGEAKHLAVPGNKGKRQELSFIQRMRMDPISALPLSDVTKSVMRRYRSLRSWRWRSCARWTIRQSSRSGRFRGSACRPRCVR